MITFITQKKHQVNEEENILQVKSTLTKEELDFLWSLNVIGIDLETNGLDPYKHDILLGVLGNKDRQFVFDLTCEITKEVFFFVLYGIQFTTTYLGANLKFDYKFIKVKFNVVLQNMFDVMIAEQRIVQGTGFSASLAAITERRLGKIMNKSVRSEFIAANQNTFIFNNKHIEYTANDIIDLFDIKTIQEEKITHNKLNFLIYDIEFPLIRVLANAELEGMDIDEDKWKENIKNNKENKFKVEVKLDEELKVLRDKLLVEEDRKYLKSGIFDLVRTKKSEEQSLDLFGEPIKEDKKYKDPYLNYGSTDTLLHIFGRFKQPIPTITNDSKKQPGPYSVPTFIIKYGKNGKSKEVINKKAIIPYTFTTGEGAMDSYLIENPNTPLKDFVKKLIELRGYNSRLNTFGEGFLTKYKNPVTKRFHTIYRQCDAITGRLQSGDKKNGWYNSQNIPREEEYRKPFHSGDNWIITTDLSGAEAVIMIDKARDEKFYEMAIVNDDAHSPLAQSVWRAIGKYRQDFNLSNIVISKKENKDKRTAYKPMTFGDIYGMGIKKRAKTLGVSEEESKVAGAVQKAMIPKTYAMVEANEKFALAKGYLILNTRTNSRIWYLDVVNANKNNSDLPSNLAHKVKNSARNGAIQGTQADMLKELMVEIDREAIRQELYERFNFALLKQVHDETVYRCNDIESLVEYLEIRDNSTTRYMVTIPEFIKRWHCQVCNRYLSFIKMTAEQNIAKTWEK